MITWTKQAIPLCPLHNQLLRTLANVIKQDKSIRGIIILNQSQACSCRPVILYNWRTEWRRLKVQGLLILQTYLSQIDPVGKILCQNNQTSKGLNICLSIRVLAYGTRFNDPYWRKKDKEEVSLLFWIWYGSTRKENHMDTQKSWDQVNRIPEVGNLACVLYILEQQGEVISNSWTRRQA